MRPLVSLAADLLRLDAGGRVLNHNDVVDRLVAGGASELTADRAARDAATYLRKQQGITLAGGRRARPRQRYMAMSLKIPPDVAEWLDRQEDSFNRNGFIVEAIRDKIK